MLELYSLRKAFENQLVKSVFHQTGFEAMACLEITREI